VEHRAERHARCFTCWGQFVAMLFCHPGRAQSLRETGAARCPRHSTLAYASAAGWPPSNATCVILIQSMQNDKLLAVCYRILNGVADLPASPTHTTI
jgi:hypothetical protein